MELTESAKLLKDILGLTYEPIAVKFFKNIVTLDGFELPSNRRYCQVLIGAREGRKLMLNPENISCPAAAWALGFKEPPAKLSSGEMPAGRQLTLLKARVWWAFPLKTYKILSILYKS